MSNCKQPAGSPIRDALVEVLGKQYRTPLGVVLDPDRGLRAICWRDVKVTKSIESILVGIANAAFGIGFVLLLEHLGVLSHQASFALCIVALVWGLLIGLLVFGIARSLLSKHNDTPALLDVRSDAVQAPVAGWTLPRDACNELVSWRFTTRDRGPRRIYWRFEALSVRGDDGKLYPVFATARRRSRSRRAVRNLTQVTGIPLAEEHPHEHDRPWTEELPHVWF